MNKIKPCLNKFITFVQLSVFAWIFLVASYGILKRCKNDVPIVTVMVFSAIVCFFLFLGYAFIKHISKKLSNKQVNIIFTICLTLATILQIVFCVKIQFYPTYDALNCFKGAILYAQNGNYNGLRTMFMDIYPRQEYFSTFTNNWGILLLESFVFRIGHFIFGDSEKVYLTLAIALNIFAFVVTSILYFACLKIVFKNRLSAQLMGSLLLFAHPVYYMFAPVFYTDTLSLPFTVGTLYLFLKYIETLSQGNNKKSFIYLFLAILVYCFGYEIKGSIIILLVAILIWSIIKLPIKKSAITVAGFLAVFAVFSLLFTKFGLAIGISTEDDQKNLRYPITHYIMMGLSENGNYSPKDRIATYNAGDYEAKKAYNMQEALRRVKKYGKLGLICHTERKIMFTWSYGEYKDPKLFEASGIHWADKTFRSYKFLTIVGAIQFNLILFMLMSFIKGFLQNKIDPLSLIRLSTIGIAMFLMIWEMKPRYLVNFIPFFLIMQLDGMDFSVKIAKEFSKAGEEHE